MIIQHPERVLMVSLVLRQESQARTFGCKSGRIGSAPNDEIATTVVLAPLVQEEPRAKRVA